MTAEQASIKIEECAGGVVCQFDGKLKGLDYHAVDLS